MRKNHISVRCDLIRNKGITNSEAILLSLFLDVDIRYGLPSNTEISSITGFTKESISRSISNLIRKGYLIRVKKYSDNDAFKTLNKKSSDVGCLFCGFSEVTLDNHHYPIRAKDGGEDTIRLCPNCHRKFHELTDYNRECIINLEVKNGD